MKSSNVDIAIVTVLPEEYAAVHELLNNPTFDPGTSTDPNLFGWEVGTVSRAIGGQYRIVLALTAKAGNIPCSQAIIQTVEQWNPRYVLLLGIAGGLSSDELSLGDVVISRVIYGYEYGKVEIKFIPRHDWIYHPDDALFASALRFSTIDAKLWSQSLSQVSTKPPKVVPGIVASGDKVVDDPTNEFFMAVTDSFPGVTAVEMEGVGAATAIDILRTKGRSIGFIMIRGISDLPKPTVKRELRSKSAKSVQTKERDASKVFAAKTAAAFAVKWISQAWPVPPKVDQPETTAPSNSNSLCKDAIEEIIFGLPQGIKKAEDWLLPIAKDASADANVEAAVYFASRGHPELIDITDLRNRWHSAICYDVEDRITLEKFPSSLVERVKSKTLSLAEAVNLLSINGSLSRFFSFRDDEEDFIDAAMFRAVEWLDIGGFEPWLRSMIDELSVGPQGGIEHALASWWLFQWCRSDLALRMANRVGLEAWLWTLMNGSIKRDEPWIRFNADQLNLGLIPYIPIAAIIPFVWHRIQPTNLDSSVLSRASEFLFQTQLLSGAWPTFGNESDGCFMSTCFAVHGLVMHKPMGWRQVVVRAAKWIASEQNEYGYWHVQGGSPVMITVLALDALELAKGSKTITFKAASTTNQSSGDA